jgi:hypothetical protein
MHFGANSGVCNARCFSIAMHAMGGEFLGVYSGVHSSLQCMDSCVLIPCSLASSPGVRSDDAFAVDDRGQWRRLLRRATSSYNMK